MPPPAWALAERALFDVTVEAVEEYAATYFDERGHLRCVERWGGNDGPDDAMENLQNWTLFYALGADERMLRLYKKAWEGHLEQYTAARAPGIPMAQDGMFYPEFVASFDWEHTGEGLQAFYFYALSAPNDRRYLARVRRFENCVSCGEKMRPVFSATPHDLRVLLGGDDVGGRCASTLSLLVHPAKLTANGCRESAVGMDPALVPQGDVRHEHGKEFDASNELVVAPDPRVEPCASVKDATVVLILEPLK